MRRTCHVIRRHRLLAATLLGSALFHAAILAPISLPLAPTIPPLPVINAELQKDQPQQQRLQTTSTPTAPSNSKLGKVATPNADTTNSDNDLKSVIKQPISNTKVATPGLTISDDELSSDPLERSYQQQILAHLRHKVRAPASLHGSVRLEIHFQYRQMATQIQVIRPSGDSAVDEWAVRAVMAANPFPPIPPELPEQYVFRPTVQIEP